MGKRKYPKVEMVKGSTQTNNAGDFVTLALAAFGVMVGVVGVVAAALGLWGL